MIELLHLIAKKNDSKAFQQLYVLFYDRLFKFALHISKSEQLSEEIVSDVFFAIWQNRKDIPKIKNFQSYIYRAVKNTALNYVQKYGKVSQSISIATIEYLASEDLTPEGVVLKNEVTKKLQTAIDSLPEQCRIIFKLAYEDNLKYKEIAEIMEISVRTIDAQVSIAKKKLKDILEGSNLETN